jgi:hypothetical protein
MPAFLVHIQQPLEGMVRSQSLSPARLIFLISLVVFFTALFVVVYVWMRKPDFGQHEGHEQPAHEQPAVSRKPVVPVEQSMLATDLSSLILCGDGHPASTAPEQDGISPAHFVDGRDADDLAPATGAR